MRRYVAAGVGLFLFATWLSDIDAKDKPPTVDVRVDEIGDGVRLIGRLGAPLEQMITIEGAWSYPQELRKDGSLIFNVSRVDGKTLAKPVEFYLAKVEGLDKRKKATPKDGETWTLRGFETGDYKHYQGETPNEYYRESGEPSPETMQQPEWFRPFTTKLVGIVKSRSNR